MDPVIVVGAGPVGLALSLALAAPGRPLRRARRGRRQGRAAPRPHGRAAPGHRRPGGAARLQPTLRDEGGARWAGWRSHAAHGSGTSSGSSATLATGRRREPRRCPAAHLPQHALTRGLRDARRRAATLVRLVTDSRLDSLEQDARGRQRAHPRARGDLVARQPSGRLRRRQVHRPQAAGHPLPGPYGGGAACRRRPAHRTPLARRGVAAPPAAVAHAAATRSPPGRCRTASGGWTGCCRRAANWSPPTPWWPGSGTPSPAGAARPRRRTSCSTPASTPLHHRLARRWRVGRAFLAGDAAHLLGALGTQGLDEGLRDADNLAWKLAQAWHHGASEPLLDSYQAERRDGRRRPAARRRPVAADTARRRRAARPYLPGRARAATTPCSPTAIWGTARWARPPSTPHSPLAPAARPRAQTRSARRRGRAGRRRAGDRARRHDACGCGTGSGRGSCWWCWSPRAPGCGTGGTG